MSILLYVFFAPIYIIISGFSKVDSFILWVFASHILLGIFSFQLIISMISQYRYSILSLYTSIAALLFTTVLVFSVILFLPASISSLFVLCGLSVVAYFSFTLLSTVLSWLYYLLYVQTGFDVV